jgi:glycosyltransferase involved in cell wall biosynthesis
VLQVVLSLNPGGTERLILDLAERLRDRVDLAVCCLDDAGAWGETLARTGIEVTALARTPGFHPSLGWRISRLAARHRAGIVHCHHYSPFVYGCIATRLRSARLIFTEHGRLADAPPSGKRRAVNQVLARLPERVFAVSEDLKRHLVSEGFSSERVEVLYNGIELGAAPGPQERMDARRRLSLPDDAFVAMSVGRLDPVKDFVTLVEAFARIVRAHPGALLVIVGDGSEREAVERRIRDCGLGAAVRLAGHRDDVRTLLPAADVYVNSSVFEGISLTILEGMAACLPVVATRVGGTPEIVSARAGLLVPSRDAAALAAAVGSLARDAGARHTMGRAARRDAESRFSLDRMVAQYFDVYAGA